MIRRLDWKIALHLPVYANTSFDPSTLCYFRRRLKENGKMRLLFERTVEVAQALGLIRRHMSQRVDATHVKERYANRFSSFGMSKEKRDERMAEIVEDGRLVQEVITEQLKDRAKEFVQLPIMETIFKENVVITERTVDEKEMIEVQEVEVPKQTIFDPRDPSIQMGRKGKCSWVGEQVPRGDRPPRRDRPTSSPA